MKYAVKEHNDKVTTVTIYKDAEEEAKRLLEKLQIDSTKYKGFTIQIHLTTF